MVKLILVVPACKVTNNNFLKKTRHSAKKTADSFGKVEKLTERIDDKCIQEQIGDKNNHWLHKYIDNSS